MTIQFDALTRNARDDAIEVAIGVSPTMKIRSGAQPATCATADSGTVIATLPLPSDWLTAASAGVKSLLGTWTDSAADSAGTPGHFRIYDSGGVCRMQGNVTATGGGGNLTLDNMSVTLGQVINITSFSITEGNA